MAPLFLAALFLAGLGSAAHGQQSPDGQPPRTGRILGLVIDGESRRGIEGVEVRVGDRMVVSNGRGRFLLEGLHTGSATLVTRLIGYETRRDSIFLPEEEAVDVVIPLARDPVDLAPIRVEVRSHVLERQGFYGRRESGYAGHFITRESLLERNPRDLSELLGPLPGVRLMRSGIAGFMVVFERAISIRGGGLCEPALFLDGVKSQIRIYDTILDPAHVEGVEVYTGATIPGRYNDPCGAVLVWTRVP